MQIRELEAFRAILETGTVSQAARSLGVSQPAVSRMLSRLERDVGFELFHRISGRLVATRPALALSKDVFGTLENVENLRKITRALREGRLGEVKLGCAPSLVNRLVPRALARFLQEMPDTRVIVEPRPSRIVVDMLTSHQLELGLLFLPVEHPGLQITPIRSFATVCVLHVDHPLAGHTTLSPQELTRERLVLLTQSDPARFAIDHAFRNARKAQRITAETPNVALAVNLAARNLGIAIVNELMARDTAPAGTVIVPFRPELVHQMALMRPANLTLSAEASKLAECLQEAIESIPLD